jgi:hypothetical protein
MGGFFLNPAVLGFTALAGLPVLIHLLNRQRYKRVRWAAMDFLLKAFQKTYRRLRLENLLLLLLRTAAVLLAALTLARPFSGGASAGIFRDPVHAFLLVDDSFSMGARAGGTTRLDKGKTLLSAHLDGLPQRSLVTVVSASRPLEPLLRDAGLDEAQEAVADMKTSDGTSDLPAALLAMAPLVQASPLGRREVLILTDLQACAWPARSGGLDPALEPWVKSGLPFRVLDVGEDSAENVAVTSVQVLSRVATAGRPVRIEGRVRNFGLGVRRGLETLLLVDGVVRDRQVLDEVAPGQEAVATLFATFPEPGSYGLEIRLAEDALPLDDRRALGLRISKGLEVLLVDGDPMPSPEDCEGYFLASALAPQGAHSPIHVTTQSIYRFGAQEDLRAVDVLALLNVRALDPATLDRIDAYVRDGGHLVVSLGDNTVVGDWNARAWRDGKGFLPAPLKEFRGPTDPAAERFARLKILDPGHPAAASLKRSQTLGTMNIRRFVACDPPADPLLRVPWAFGVEGLPDEPAILDRPVGSGRVILVTTALDKEWGDLPLSFDYVALVHDLVYAAAQGSQVRETLVGFPLVLELPGEHAGESLRVVFPDDKTEQVAPEILPSRIRLTTPPLTRAGLYRLAVGNPEEVLERFAANPDPAESDLTRLESAELKQGLPGLDLEVVKAGAQVAKPGGTRELWRPLLMAVGIILALESFLAWRFGRE